MSESQRDSLSQVAAEIRGCTRCRLAETRTQAVPGEGPLHAPLMLIGEAPGAKEDASGRPFQGASGRFLDHELEALGVHRAQVFVTSVNKCRPPDNRNPRPDEMRACAGYLDRQLALIAPQVVLAMGGVAARRLHPQATGARVSDLRAKPAEVAGARLLVTLHPAAAMRFPSQRQPFRTDLATACRLAGLCAGNPSEYGRHAR